MQLTDKEMLEEIQLEYENNVKDGLLPRIADSDYEWLIERAGRVQELEEDLEVLDSAIFRIGLTINNPDTSDDEKWEEVNGIISKAMEGSK